MTRGTAILWPGRAGHVLCVIELNIEALFELFGECFQWRRTVAHGGMTNGAHGNIRRSELRQVTAGAILVTRKAGPRGIVRSMMAVCTSHRRVTLAGVQKFRVVDVVPL